MNRHLLSLLLLFLPLLLVVSPLFGQDSYMRDEPLVTELRHLYLRAGCLYPTDSYPVSRRDLFAQASLLAEREIGPEIRDDLEAYFEKLGYEEDAITIGASPALAYEHYFRTENRWLDLKRLLIDQTPFFDLGLYYYQDGAASLYIEGTWKREYAGFAPSNAYYTVPGNPFALENQSIYKGFVRLYWGPAELEFGRNSSHFGPARESSLLPSAALPFLDMIRLDLPLGPLEMNWFVATLENRQAAEDGTFPLPPGYVFGENVIISTMHRFTYHFNRFSLGITGLCFIAREQNGFLLGDLFPVISWHNAEVGEHNISLVLDGRVAPLAGLELFGQVGFDDINVGTIGVADSGVPTISAWILGGEYYWKLPLGYLAAYLEGGYTHYLWGNYDEGHYLERAIYRMRLDGGNRAIPMTSPYGPGSYWVTSRVDWKDVYGFDFGLLVEYIRKNESADLYSTPYVSSTAVASAASSNTVVIGLEAAYSFRSFLSARLLPVLYVRDGDPWFELTLGAQIGGEFWASFDDPLERQ